MNNDPVIPETTLVTPVIVISNVATPPQSFAPQLVGPNTSSQSPVPLGSPLLLSTLSLLRILVVLQNPIPR